MYLIEFSSTYSTNNDCFHSSICQFRLRQVRALPVPRQARREGEVRGEERGGHGGLPEADRGGEGSAGAQDEVQDGAAGTKTTILYVKLTG